MVRRYQALPGIAVPAYTAVDLRAGWRPTRAVELSVLLQNLFDPGHVEWSPGAEHKRAGYVRVRLDF